MSVDESELVWNRAWAIRRSFLSQLWMIFDIFHRQFILEVQRLVATQDDPEVGPFRRGVYMWELRKLYEHSYASYTRFYDVILHTCKWRL